MTNDNQQQKRQVVIEWEDIAPSLKIASEKTGLEYMQALVDRKAPAPPIGYLMNMEPIEVGDGYAIFAGTPGEQHLNPMGGVHGGYASTLLDSALGCAVHTTLPQGMGYGTAQLNVHLTRPITLKTGRLICEGQVVHRGKRMVTAEATLKDEDGKLYAHGTTTCMVFPMG